MLTLAVTKYDNWNWNSASEIYYWPATLRFQKEDALRFFNMRQIFDRKYDERWTMECFMMSDRETIHLRKRFFLASWNTKWRHGNSRGSDSRDWKVGMAEQKIIKGKKRRRSFNQLYESWTTWKKPRRPTVPVYISTVQHGNTETRMDRISSQQPNRRGSTLGFPDSTLSARYMNLFWGSNLNYRHRRKNIWKGEMVGLVNFPIQSVFLQVDCFLRCSPLLKLVPIIRTKLNASIP